MTEYKCQFCNIKPYKTQKGYNNHIIKKHPETLNNAPPVQVDSLSRYCKYFYDQMRKMGKTNNNAKEILLELILLRKLSEKLDLLNVENKETLKFETFALNDFQDADVCDRIKEAIEIYKYGEFQKYFIIDHRSYYNDFCIKTLTDLVWRLSKTQICAGDFTPALINEKKSSFTSENVMCAFDILEIKPNMAIYDPCMGTGGFLKYFIKKFKNIEIYGSEINCDLYLCTITDFLINYNLSADNFTCCNSLLQNKKFDIIVVGPPFEKTTEQLKNIKTGRLEFQFLQHVVEILNENGQAIILLPITFLTNKTAHKFRKFVLDTITVSKIFIENDEKINGNRVCVLYLINTKPNLSSKIEFLNIQNNKSITMASLTLDEIMKENYSLLISKYIKPEIIGTHVKLIKLKDVLAINVSSTSSELSNKKYPLYGAGDIKDYVYDYTYNGTYCKLAVSGVCASNCIKFIHGKFSITKSAVVVSSKHPAVSNDYLYCWLFVMAEKIFNECCFGVAQKSLNLEILGEFDFPIIECTIFPYMSEFIKTACKFREKQLKHHDTIAKFRESTNSLINMSNPKIFKMKELVEIRQKECDLLSICPRHRFSVELINYECVRDEPAYHWFVSARANFNIKSVYVWLLCNDINNLYEGTVHRRLNYEIFSEIDVTVGDVDYSIIIENHEYLRKKIMSETEFLEKNKTFLKLCFKL